MSLTRRIMGGPAPLVETAADRWLARVGTEAASTFLDAFGMDVQDGKIVARTYEPKYESCPTCSEVAAYWKRQHEDTSLEEVVLYCSACGKTHEQPLKESLHSSPKRRSEALSLLRGSKALQPGKGPVPAAAVTALHRELKRLFPESHWSSRNCLPLAEAIVSYLNSLGYDAVVEQGDDHAWAQSGRNRFDADWYGIFRESLTERGLGKLFHVTNVTALRKILQSDTIELTYGRVSKQHSDHRASAKPFYLSLSRSSRGSYMDSGDCMLVFDAGKLANRYRLRAFDYWGPEWHAINRDSKSGRDAYANDEMEERLYHDNHSIPKASSYLLEIHVYAGNGREHSHLHWPWIEQTCKEHGISAFVYTDLGAYRALNKAKAAQASDVPKPSEQFAASQADWEQLMANREVPDYEKHFINLIDWMASGELEPPAKLRRDWRSFDFPTSFSTDVHNARSGKAPHNQKALFKLNRLMNAYGVDGAAELAKRFQDQMFEKEKAARSASVQNQG